jgi:hypothetical protein
MARALLGALSPANEAPAASANPNSAAASDMTRPSSKRRRRSGRCRRGTGSPPVNSPTFERISMAAPPSPHPTAASQISAAIFSRFTEEVKSLFRDSPLDLRARSEWAQRPCSRPDERPLPTPSDGLLEGEPRLHALLRRDAQQAVRDYHEALDAGGHGRERGDPRRATRPAAPMAPAASDLRELDERPVPRARPTTRSSPHTPISVSVPTLVELGIAQEARIGR